MIFNEQSGNIRYKGVSIETVTLEGDNLFGDNYSLGTKNINVDMVTHIEAVPLLKKHCLKVKKTVFKI
ncbi:MAG: hypothetical protein P8H44_02830 [Flavobacteriaceae bacterium]|nr:hypothetical protein [Flavobacteriaceae bacterium]